ncbi:hypothetical protein [Brenneria goodwinii]
MDEPESHSVAHWRLPAFFIMLASRRYAMLDDGMGFSLMPWRPVISG